MNDEEVHVTATEARGGSRGSQVRLILVASLVLIVVLFGIVFAMGGVSG